MQQMGLTPGQPLVPGQVQAVVNTPFHLFSISGRNYGALSRKT